MNKLLGANSVPAPAEHVFRAAANALEVGLVSDDDKSSCQEGRAQDGPIRVEDHPDAEREQAGGDDRTGRDVVGNSDYHNKDDHHSQERTGGEIKERTDETRDGFAAMELEEDRVRVTRHHGDGGGA